MRIYLSLLFIIISFVGYSQTPGVQWMNSLGGSSTEKGSGVFITNDSGYLFIGQTFSNDHDVTDFHGGSSADIWVVKTDKRGIIQWKKCFGGTGSDQYVTAFYHANNGTTTIMGATGSNDNDVSGNHGGSDLWIFNIDALGNINWQKCLGGSSTETFVNADVLADGSCILIATTRSSNGDISGYHGTGNTTDIWVVKMSNNGILEWQKCLGGSSSDSPTFIKAVNDGNYLVAGKITSNDGDVTGNHGGTDAWIVKLNNSGNIVWQRACGSTNIDEAVSLALSTIDNNVIVLGTTAGNNGDVSGNHGMSGIRDAWLFALDYTTSSLTWQRCIGGTYYDGGITMTMNQDGSILAVAGTLSSDGDAVGYHGTYGNPDILLAKVSSNGALQWSKCYGGSGYEVAYSIINDFESGEYFINAYTSSLNGDVVGYHPLSLDPSDTTHDAWLLKVAYNGDIKWQRTLGGSDNDDLYISKKTGNNEFITVGEASSKDGDLQFSLGNVDFWIVKIGAVNTIKGTLFRDVNSNGVKDPEDVFYPDAIVKTQKGNAVKMTIPRNGLFTFDADTGNHITSVQLPLPYYNVVPAVHNSSFTTYFNTDSFSFALQPIAILKDLVINVAPLWVARPGFPVIYKVLYKNIGTEAISAGEILFKKDPRLSYISSFPAISSSNGDTLKWAYSNFDPLDTASIIINFQVATPPTVNVGDTLTSIAIITPVINDVTPSDDTAFIRQRVTGSYDPNDKNENNGGQINQGYISSGKYLNYTIRFQNTGTDTAFNVIVRDTLDSKLDWNTLQMVAASHPYQVSIVDQNKIAWTFPDINLPDSNINEPASHGFIAYRIKPLSGLSPGDVISNSASIYFDFNLPVITNTVLTEVAGSQALPLTLLNFKGVYRNDITELRWTTTNEYNVQKFEIERSFNGIDYNSIGTQNARNSSIAVNDYVFIDDLKNITQTLVYYRLKMIDIDSKHTYSNVILIRRDNPFLKQIQILPNPIIAGSAQVIISSETTSTGTIRVLDSHGKVLSLQYEKFYPGTNFILIKDLERLSKGIYFLQFTRDNQLSTTRFLIQ